MVVSSLTGGGGSRGVQCILDQLPISDSISSLNSIIFIGSFSTNIHRARADTSSGITVNLFKYFFVFLSVYFASANAVFWSSAECDSSILAIKSFPDPVFCAFIASMSSIVIIWLVGSSMIVRFVRITTSPSSPTMSYSTPS